MGIKVYPVAASGVDLEAEYLLRIAAQVTLARYLFLTDDSGIGQGHDLPSIACYNVQYLRDVMAQVILSELSGTRVEPEPNEILRVVGNPVQGTCMVQ